MGFCKSDQKSIPVVGFLTHNDCDVLRAKTGIYRWVCMGAQKLEIGKNGVVGT